LASETAPAQGDQKGSTSGWLGSLVGGVFGSGDSGPPPAGASGGLNGDHGAGMAPEAMANAPGGGHGGPAGPVGPQGYPPAGAEGYPTAPGAPGGQAQQYEKGTAEYAAYQVASRLAVGDQAGLEDFVSEKARGDFAKFRTGEADQVQVAEAKQALAGAQLISVRDVNGGKSVILRNQAGASVTLTTKREEGGYKVTGMKVEKARVRMQQRRR
jgi:hypothetical protein